MNDETARAVLVAMQLLYKQLVENAKVTADSTAAVKEAAPKSEARSENAKNATRDESGRFASAVEEATKRGNAGLLNELRAGLATAGNRIVGAAASSTSQAMGVLISRFALVLGPLAIFAALLSSNAAGFQVLGTAVKLLVATLGPLLLPIIAVLAAGLLELSEKLWERIVPALESWYTAVVTNLLPAVSKMVDSFMEVVKFFTDLAKSDFGKGFIGGVSGTNKDEKSKPENVLDQVVKNILPGGESLVGIKDGIMNKLGLRGNAESSGGVFGDSITSDLRKQMRDAMQGALTGRGELAPDTGKGGYEGGDFGGGEQGTEREPSWMSRMIDKFSGGASGEPNTWASRVFGGGGAAAPAEPGKPSSLAVITQELRQSLGPKASFSGLAQASKNAQLAALNQSPLEQMMLDRLTKSLGVLERVEQNTRKRGVD